MTMNVSANHEMTNRLVDCIGVVEIELPSTPLQSDKCIATIGSAGFAAYLDDMLGSLSTNAACDDVLKVVLVIDKDVECAQVAMKYGAAVIPCTLRTEQGGPAIKSALYSIARIVDARQFICLDADMLILEDIMPIFTALDVCIDGSILVCKDSMAFRLNDEANSLEKILRTLYKGHTDDLIRLLGNIGHEPTYPFVVNDGLFAGNRKALLMLDELIRNWPGVFDWVFAFDRSLRNQFVFNLVLAHLQCGVEMAPVYNVQLAWEDVELRWDKGKIAATWQDQRVKVLHFNGKFGRHKYPEWRGLLSKQPRDTQWKLD